MTIRTYTSLQQLSTLHERFEYLSLSGEVGAATFGMERYMNQNFYHSRRWQDARRDAIARDMGFEIGTNDVPIQGQYFVHHMNPVTLEDLEEGSDNLIDLEGLITCGFNMHNAIHYGDKSLIPQPYVERQPGDTKLWNY